VIRDAEDVELEAAVEVDQLRQCQLAVAPRRVRVELAEQEVASHGASVVCAGERLGNRAVKRA
jgi:hypothetical protein